MTVKTTSWPAVHEIEIVKLWIPAFQRPCSDDWVARTTRSYDRMAIGTLLGAESQGWLDDDYTGPRAGEPGYVAILDGQGRLAVMAERGEESAPVQVLNITRQEAADLTVKINAGRRDVKAFYRLRMEWAAERPDALKVKKRVEAVGFKLASDTNHENEIGAITTVEDIYYGRRGVQLHVRPDVLTPTLELIRDSLYARPKSTDADLLRGIAFVFASNRDESIDRDRLINILAARPPSGWLPENGRVDQRSRAAGVADAITMEYNLGRLGKYGRLPDQKWIQPTTETVD